MKVKVRKLSSNRKPAPVATEQAKKIDKSVVPVINIDMRRIMQNVAKKVV